MDTIRVNPKAMTVIKLNKNFTLLIQLARYENERLISRAETCNARWENLVHLISPIRLDRRYEDDPNPSRAGVKDYLAWCRPSVLVCPL